MTETFVLVHGSWHGGWAWDGVRSHLEDGGHRTVAPTLAGHGPGAERSGVHHADCVESVVRAVEADGAADVVLVGHSFGGSVISKVVERIPDRVRRLVFLTAFVLENGQSVADNLPPDQVEEFGRLAADSPDGTVACPWEVFRDLFMQDAASDEARAVWERLCPQPYMTWTDPLDLTRFYELDIPKSYIACRDDLALAPGAWHPGMSARLGAFDLVEISGSHEVMFTRPAEVAQAILRASGTGGANPRRGRKEEVEGT
jgi:pimeloyl-ACP methyl ester carboxylesterase